MPKFSCRLKQSEKVLWVFRHLIATYDHSVLGIICLNAFNNGAMVLILKIYVNMCQQRFHVSACYCQFSVALMMLPIILQFFYGLISETFPIYNSRLRSYLMLMSAFQILVGFSFAFFHLRNILVSSITLMISTISIAWIDVLADGLIVIEKRKDPKNGSEDLQVFAWLSLSVGGILPSFVTFIFSVSNLNVDYNNALAIPGVLGIVIFIVAFRFKEKVEEHSTKLNKLSFG